MKFILTVFIAAALATSLSAQDPDCWHYEIGDAPIVGSVEIYDATSVSVFGNYAYVAAQGAGMYVVDIVDPENPEITGSVDIPGWAADVASAESYVYVADHSGIRVINVTNPYDPWIEGSVDTPDSSPNGVSISGHYAYVADLLSGLLVVDISNPNYPWIVGGVETLCGGHKVAVLGDYAYMASGSCGLQILDISDPKNPVITGSVDTDSRPPYGVAVVSDLAYVRTRSGGIPPVDGAVYVVDISVPQNPGIIGFVGTPGATFGLAVAGNYAYAGDAAFGLQVIDVADPENPLIIGGTDTPGFAVGVAVSVNAVYVADISGGLLALPVQCEPVGIENGPDTPDTDADIPVTGLQLAVHPNPFNPQTTVAFSLPQSEWADISVYDLTARCVTTLASRTFTPGTHTLTWNGHDSNGRPMPSGTYIVRLETESNVEARKVMLVR